MSTPLVRPATELDAPAIARIHVETWRAAYRGIVPEAHLAALSVERREAHWRQAIATGSAQVWVALGTGEAIIGWVSFGASRDADAPAGMGELHAIYVAPAAWRQGAGSALWEIAQQRLRTAGYTGVTLWVLERNAPAIAFYESCGFAPGTRKEVPMGEAVLTEVRYGRALAPA